MVACEGLRSSEHGKLYFGDAQDSPAFKVCRHGELMGIGSVATTMISQFLSRFALGWCGSTQLHTVKPPHLNKTTSRNARFQGRMMEPTILKKWLRVLCAFTCSSTHPRVALKQGKKNTLTSHGLAMTGAFNSLERFWSMACAVFSVWKWQRMGSGWGATSYQAGRGSWPMAKGSSGNGSKHGEPVDRENFIALSAQHKLGVNGFKTNVLLLWSGG